MAATQITRTYDSVLSTTLARYASSKFIDQITDEFPVLWWLMGEKTAEKANLPRHRTGKKSFAGGESIRWPVSYALNSTVKRLPTQYESVSLQPQDNETIAQLEWRQIAGSVTISNLELQKNQGSETRLIDLLQERIANTERAIRDRLSRDIHGDGTDSGAVIGLQTAVDSAGTYAQISRTSNSWWAAQETAVSAAFSADTLDSMTDAVVAATIGTDSPDLCVTTATIYRQYMDIVDDAKRFTSDRADARFKYLDFQGIPMIFDRDCLTQTMYFLNSNHVYWAFMRGAEIATTPFAEGTPNGQLARYALVHLTGALVNDEPRKSAKLTGIS